jgi:sodium/hydrogen exchanger 8
MAEYDFVMAAVFQRVAFYCLLRSRVKLQVDFTNITIFYAFTKFMFISIGSIILGFLIAIAASLTFKRATYLHNLPQMEISLMLLFAYSSYFAAEVFGLSGIMSLFFCSIALAHYNYYNLSHATQHATHLYFKSVAQVCDTFVFAYLGITIGVSIDPSSGYTLTWSLPLIGLTLILCLVGRAANVFPLSWVVNHFRGSKTVSGSMQVCQGHAPSLTALPFL